MKVTLVNIFICIFFSTMLGQAAQQEVLKEFNAFVLLNKSISAKKGQVFTMKTQVFVGSENKLVQEFFSESVRTSADVIYNRTGNNESFFNGNLLLQVLREQKVIYLLPKEYGDTLLKRSLNTTGSTNVYNDSISVQTNSNGVKVFTLFPSNSPYFKMIYEFKNKKLLKCKYYSYSEGEVVTTVIIYSAAKITNSFKKYSIKYFMRQKDGVLIPSENYIGFKVIDQRN